MLFHGAEGHQRSNGQIRNPKQFWCIVFLCHYQDPLQAGIDCWIMWLYSIGPTGVKLEIASVWHSWSASMLSMSLVNTRVGFRVHICGGKSAYKVHSGGKKKQEEEKGKLYLRRKQWTASGNCHHHFPGETRSSESITHTREAAYYAAEGNSNAYVWEETQTYSLGREEPCKTIDSKRFLQQTDPKTISAEGVTARGVGRNARGAGDGGKRKRKEKMVPRWGGGGGGDAGKKRRLWRRKTAGIGEGELPAASATSPRNARASGALPLPVFARWLPSPPSSFPPPAPPLFFLVPFLFFSLSIYFPEAQHKLSSELIEAHSFMGPRPMGPSYPFSFSFFSLALPHEHSLENRLKFKYVTNL